VRTDWPGLNLNVQVSHVQSLQSATWTTAGSDKICLVYNCLDTSRPGQEGILIDCPEKVGKPTVLAHFIATKMMLESPVKPTDPTEATGEAAALCILKGGTLRGQTTLTLAHYATSNFTQYSNFGS
jgi:hypothetical protein